ncbi:MAG: acetamidase/formamidase family protein [Pseudomonadota bacterium]|nr:acetamidase/formamidase family protein [Pseudomonadota bacterium]
MKDSNHSSSDKVKVFTHINKESLQKAVKNRDIEALIKNNFRESQHYYIPAHADTVHWGFFSYKQEPLIHINSGDFATIETMTHHSGDDYERMIKGDPGAESIFHWTSEQKNVDRRGAGSTDSANGSGGGLGAHICTGPVYINGAQPGDVLEVRILDVQQRPCFNPEFAGKAFGSNAAATWGFQYRDYIGDEQREVVTIYELDAFEQRNWAQAVYNFRWTPQTDPDGVVHPTIDYPGVVVDHNTIEKNFDVLKDIRIPVRPHFGTIGVAPKEEDYVSSIPPSYNGGNLDNWRISKGGTMFFPVSVDGALFSVGDPHASQGDSELSGSAIECSLTGQFQFILHKAADLQDSKLEKLAYPLLETKDEWVIHGFSFPNYLADLGEGAQMEVFRKATMDLAMRDAYRKTREFLMTTRNLSEDEAISLMSIGVDFGITQVVDGNWGIHAVISKSMFPDH